MTLVDEIRHLDTFLLINENERLDVQREYTISPIYSRSVGLLVCTHGDNRLKLFDVDQFSADVSVCTTYAPMDSERRYFSVAARQPALSVDVEKIRFCSGHF